ncbi:dihydrolipoamide acetyltransferase family protein [Picosynechococcus sp. PCC 8807]|uniref:dihydrolipoamide acetyltransferase family protein n=1 Tax=Picosynechococcus sp. PCC 8807 TaxID=195248 RepID=UPI0008104305|nr:dihydrolipoamide acetyltransferase family protein [Picosynechococcus sp. PCC 8807]ANV89268.1 branched-chain alpha-keto acid dehydrogenase subunit E2 [Picosynechococcus sp. PCC 8807]
MIHDIFMPALSSTMTEGKIVSWTKSPGDKVAKGETVVVVESDKADMDVESFNEGFLAAIIVDAGEEAPVGSAIALIAETEAEIPEAKQKAATLKGGSSAPAANPAPAPAPAAPSPEPAPVVAAPAPTPAAPTPAPVVNDGRIIASPRAKKLAKEFGVDLKTVPGSGPHGRIVAEDVEKAAGKAPTIAPAAVSTPAPTTSKPAAPAPAPVAVTPGEVVPLNTLQQAVVRNMNASLNVPTFHVSYDITTDALDALYKQIKSKGVTMTGLLAKAVAVTLQKHPVVNASFGDNAIQYSSGINVAVAVAMPDGGLITPVLQNADQMDIYSLSRKWKDLVDRARLKQLQPDEYSTGTFTLSNLGMFGVSSFDAILPPGQGSILAIGGAQAKVVATPDGLFGVKKQMTVNITCDHRIIYGADAAAFLKDLADLIENNTHSLTL